MKIKIKINNVAKDVEVIEDAPGKLTVKMQGRNYACQIDDVESMLPKKTPDASSKPSDQTIAYVTGQTQYDLRQENARPSETVIEIKSPLPGVISSIEQKVGANVNRGDVVLYLEAMKMLNDIVAPKSGIIDGFEKSSGQTVNVGDILFRMKIIGE